MSTRNSIILIAILLVVTVGVSLALGNQMPGSMASHWNAQGQVDGYSSKTFGLFFVPGLELGLVALFLCLPLIDPRKENIQKFRPTYNLFIVLIMGFMSYLHFLTLAWNLGWIFNLMRWMSPAYSALMFFVGVLLGKAQPNWFIGIRTPWTLSDNEVWRRTHQLGGTAFKVCGAISLAGIFFPQQAIWFLLIPILGVALGLVVYSYLYYRSLHQREA
jgi:uncharacterized membrane protein